MPGVSRSVVAVIVAAIFVAIVIFTMPTVEIKPRGLILPQAIDVSLKPLSTKQVAVYSNALNAPVFYKTVGYISIAYHTLEDTLSAQKEVTAFARQLAAQYGANGMIVEVAHTVAGTPRPMAMQVLRGHLIFSTM